MRSLTSRIVLRWVCRPEGFAATQASEAGYTAIEAAVAAALLGVVLVPLVAFASYLALTDRAALYGDAVRLAEAHAESALLSESALQSQDPEPGARPTAGSNSLSEPAAEEQVFEEGRLLVIRTRTATGTHVTVTVQVKHARTGRVLVALERSAFAPTAVEGPAVGVKTSSTALLGGGP